MGMGDGKVLLSNDGVEVKCCRERIGNQLFFLFFLLKTGDKSFIVTHFMRQFFLDATLFYVTPIILLVFFPSVFFFSSLLLLLAFLLSFFSVKIDYHFA